MSTLQFTVKEIKLLVILNTSKKLSNSIKLKLQRGKKVFENALFLVVDISLFPPPLYSPPLPPKPILYLKPSSLSSTTNNTDSGAGWGILWRLNRIRV